MNALRYTAVNLFAQHMYMLSENSAFSDCNFILNISIWSSKFYRFILNEHHMLCMKQYSCVNMILCTVIQYFEAIPIHLKSKDDNFA